MVDMLLEQGHPVRAFVRRDDERAQSLREAGAEVFVGDLLKFADVAAALKGVRRIYFSMSLSPYYSDALTLMAAAARAQGDIEAFVNMSNYEQSYMTLEKMTAPDEERRSWLGGLVTAAAGALDLRAGAGLVRHPDHQRARDPVHREPLDDLAATGRAEQR
jgi:hypothetical protein